MLRKLISIKNVGRFRNYSASGDVELRRYNLVFAENGRGKTTLCAIFRSLSTSTPAFIVGRRTLGSVEPPEVQILLASGNTTFRDGAWSVSFSDIAVFDGTYVSENVFAGDVVDTENKRNLYRVIIGSPGVRLAEQLNELDSQIRAKGTEIRDNRTLLERHAAPGMTIQAFIGLPYDPAIDAKIAAKEQDLQAVRRAEEIRRRPALTVVPAPVFPPPFATLLAKTLANIAPDADRRVAAHIRKHRMEARGEPWLSEGLQYIGADCCPFCGQGLAGIELIEAYRGFFSREYHALRQEAADLLVDVEQAIGDRVAAGIEQVLLQNNGEVEFWRQYCPVVPPALRDAATVGQSLTVLKGSRLISPSDQDLGAIGSGSPGRSFHRRPPHI